MEYVTINQLNEFRVVMTNWWIILASITCMWCSASIIVFSFINIRLGFIPVSHISFQKASYFYSPIQ